MVNALKASARNSNLEPSRSGIANCLNATLDAPHGVQKEDEESPERDEFKAPFGKLIVARRRLVATRADRGRAFARPHGYFDALVVRTESRAMIDKAAKTMAAV